MLGVFAIVSLAQGWTGSTLTHALPFVQDEFALSDAQVFDLMAIVRVVSLAALLISWRSDRSGRRVPLLASFALLTTANLATAFIPSYSGFVIVQSIARIGTIALGALAVVMLAEELGREVRGYVIGIYSLVGSIGTGLGLLLRPLEGSAGWRLLFGLSALPLVALPFLLRRVRESRAFTRPVRRPSIGAGLTRDHAAVFWPMALLSFALSAFSSPVANLALIRLENQLAWTTGSASLLLIATTAPGVTLGLLAGGRFADVIGRKATEAISIVVGVTGGVLLYFLEGWPMGFGLFFATLGASAFAPAFASQRTELFPGAIRSTAGAWLINASILGGLTGFTAGRFAVDAWGLSSTMAILGGFLLLSSLVILRLPETRGLNLVEPPSNTS